MCVSARSFIFSEARWWFSGKGLEWTYFCRPWSETDVKFPCVVLYAHFHRPVVKKIKELYSWFLPKITFSYICLGRLIIPTWIFIYVYSCPRQLNSSSVPYNLKTKFFIRKASSFIFKLHQILKHIIWVQLFHLFFLLYKFKSQLLIYLSGYHPSNHSKKLLRYFQIILQLSQLKSPFGHQYKDVAHATYTFLYGYACTRASTLLYKYIVIVNKTLIKRDPNTTHAVLCLIYCNGHSLFARCIWLKITYTVHEGVNWDNYLLKDNFHNESAHHHKSG